MQETIILGIDPGTTIMGFGIVKTNGKSSVIMLEMGALHLSKYKDHALKLKKIFDKCSQLIETYSPDGFPDIENANHPINVITVHDNLENKFYTWGTKEYTGKGKQCKIYLL